MAKIKHTKNEMKAQREALNRFERFLPMLQLKKQQLQVSWFSAVFDEFACAQRTLRAQVIGPASVRTQFLEPSE